MKTPGGRNILSMNDLSRTEVGHLLNVADEMEDALRLGERLNILEGRIMAALFFQPSTRTRLSFETAMLRLGGQVMGFSDIAQSRSGACWGEALRDTASVLDGYADVIVIRHPRVGAVREFANFAHTPVVNAGDGIGAGAEHPTQALLDLYTIRKEFGTLDGLKVLIVGGLHQRAARSLMLGLGKFRDVTLYLACPDRYWLTPQEQEALQSAGVSIERVEAVEDAIHEVDVIYHNGMSEDSEEYVPENLKLTAAKLQAAQDHLIVMHPLPRAEEISYEVDDTHHARYIQQAWNGIPLRMALLRKVLATVTADLYVTRVRTAAAG